MVHPTLEPKENFNMSKFYMWRCIVTMAHADGLLHEQEEEYLRTVFINMRDRAGLPQEHYDVLVSDLTDHQQIEDLLPYINDPAFVGQIVYFARLLAYKDGELHPSEEALLKKMHIAATDGLNMELIKEKVHENVAQEMVIHEVKMDSMRPEKGLASLLDQLMLHFGIDLMDE